MKARRIVEAWRIGLEARCMPLDRLALVVERFGCCGLPQSRWGLN